MQFKLRKNGLKNKMYKQNTFIYIVLPFLFLVFITGGCSKQDKADMVTYKNTLMNSPKQAQEMKLKENLKLIRNSIQIFVASNQRFPNNLKELAKKGVMDHIPHEPFGGRYIYNSANGSIKSSSHPSF